MFERNITEAIGRWTPSVTTLLVGINIFTSVIIIVLWELSVIPLKSLGAVAFSATLAFLFALHRPRWAFWFFVGLLPLEIINIVPDEVGVSVRPYQLVGAVLAVAVLVRIFTGRSVRRMFRWRWWDTAAVLFVLSGFCAAMLANDVASAMKQAVIVASFIAWYFLARYFVRGPVTARMPFLFLTTNSVVIGFYAFWQNWQFIHGATVSTVMSARPNATFTEPDWLGIFFVFMVALLHGALYRIYLQRGRYFFAHYPLKKQFAVGALAIMMMLSFMSVLITVARSAWLGTVCVLVVFYGYIISRRKWHALYVLGSITIATAIIAYTSVTMIPLTTFDIGNRTQSASNGMQVITIACATQEDGQRAQEIHFIENIAQLESMSCRHIMLEEIESVKNKGETVVEVVRPDPSSAVRKEVYTKVFALLRSQWSAVIFGVGWGQADFGVDESGARLNTSNIFLEVLLSSGVVGLVAFIALIGSVVWRAVVALYASAVPRSVQVYSIIALLGSTAIIVPNIFNAGILLGFVWVFIGMMAGLRKS